MSPIRIEGSILPEATNAGLSRETPCERGLEAGIDDNGKFQGHSGQLENPEAPAITPSPREIGTGSVDEGASGARGACPRISSESIATKPSTGAPVPAPDSEKAGAEERVEGSQQSQDTPRTIEQDTNGAVALLPSGVPVIHGTIRRRSPEWGDVEQSRIFLEPPTKRVRIEPEVTTAMAPSISASTCGPSSQNPEIPGTWSSSVSRKRQRSSSDMILESETEASPSPWPDNGAANEKVNCDDSPRPSERQPLVESRADTPAVGKLQVEEIPMPPIQCLSLASPEIKPNPFTACKAHLYSPSFLSRVALSIMTQEVGRISLHTPSIDYARGNAFVGTSRTPVNSTYAFSAAEIRTLVALRGSDEDCGQNKLVFNLDWGAMNGITKWRNFKAGQGPLEGSICLSLACYPVDSVAALMGTATENQPLDSLIRQARIKSSWPSGPSFRSTLRDGSGKPYAIPPFSTTDDNFIDISESAMPGTNTYTIEDNGQSLSNWLFAVYVHSPTIAYFDAMQAKLDKEKEWVDTLTSFTIYTLPGTNWDPLQPQDGQVHGDPA